MGTNETEDNKFYQMVGNLTNDQLKKVYDEFIGANLMEEDVRECYEYSPTDVKYEMIRFVENLK